MPRNIVCNHQRERINASAPVWVPDIGAHVLHIIAQQSKSEDGMTLCLHLCTLPCSGFCCRLLC